MIALENLTDMKTSRLELRLDDFPQAKWDELDSQPSDEPSTPDSGFSSDDCSSTETLSPHRKFDRSRTLPSALRRTHHNCGKRVRFADSMGLQLADMQYFTKEDESLSASSSLTSLCSTKPSASTVRLSVDNFAYRSESESVNLARCQKVCVASLLTNDTNITGHINVHNISFDKKVLIKYTTDNWKTIKEVEALYSHGAPACSDVDTFNFVLELPTNIKIGSDVQFCVSYSVGPDVFWDNNCGQNFHVSALEQFRAVQPLQFSQSYPAPARRSPSRKHRTTGWGRVEMMDSEDDLPAPPTSWRYRY